MPGAAENDEAIKFRPGADTAENDKTTKFRPGADAAANVGPPSQLLQGFCQS